MLVPVLHRWDQPGGLHSVVAIYLQGVSVNTATQRFRGHSHIPLSSAEAMQLSRQRISPSLHHSSLPSHRVVCGKRGVPLSEGVRIYSRVSFHLLYMGHLARAETASEWTCTSSLGRLRHIFLRLSLEMFRAVLVTKDCNNSLPGGSIVDCRAGGKNIGMLSRL